MTPTQAELLEFIQQHEAANNCQPTAQQICERFGWPLRQASPALRELIAAGLYNQQIIPSKLRKPPVGSRYTNNEAEYVPSRTMIWAECVKIRNGWSEEERMLRRGFLPPEKWEVPTMTLGTVD